MDFGHQLIFAWSVLHGMAGSQVRGGKNALMENKIKRKKNPIDIVPIQISDASNRIQITKCFVREFIMFFINLQYYVPTFIISIRNHTT